LRLTLLLWSLRLQGFHCDLDFNFVAVVPEEGIETVFGSLERDNGIRATGRDTQ
jgi:hypothetical protein